MHGLSRRGFLKVSIGGAALLAVGGLFIEQESGYDLPDALRAQLRFFSPKGYLVFRAAAARLCDTRGSGIAGPRADEVALYADRFLARGDDQTRTDVGRLLGLFEHGPLLFAFAASRFTRLPAARQDDYLWSWAESGLGVKRAGFAALKSIAMMGFYRDRRTFAALGYGGPIVPRGWNGGAPDDPPAR